MTIAFVNSGTFASGLASAAPGVPASPAAGNRFVAFVGTKPYNATTGTPSDYTKRATSTSGTTTTGNGTGSTFCVAYDHAVVGTESGTVSFTVTTGDPAMARIHQFSKSSTKVWDIAATALADTTNAGDNQIVAIGSAIDIKAGDMLVWAATMPNDNDLIGSPVMTVPGCTVGTITTIAHDITTDGNDAGIWYYYASVTAGASTGSPVFTAVTGPLAGGGTDPDDTAVPLVRLREAPNNIGPIASTLGGVTASFSGSVSEAEATSGDLAATLGGVTASLEAAEVDSGDLAGTLGGVTASFTATETDTGDLAATIGGVTASMAGTETASGDLAGQLGGVTGSFTAAEVDSGDMAGTLGAATFSGEGTATEAQAPAGDLAATLGGATGSLEGTITEPTTGDIASTLSGFTSSMSGAVEVVGDITATLGSATCAMQGEAEVPKHQGGWNQLQEILDDIRSQPSNPHLEPLWPNEVERHRPAKQPVVIPYDPVDLDEDPRWGPQ